MNKETLRYVGVVWSDDPSFGKYAEALCREFSQPIAYGSFASSLSKKAANAHEPVVGSPAGDIVWILCWGFAGVHFLSEMPEALHILEEWLGDKSPDQVIAFFATQKDLVDAVIEKVTGCGYGSTFWSLRGSEEEPQPSAELPAIEDGRAGAGKEYAQAAKADMEHLADAQNAGNVEASGQILQRMHRRREKSRDDSRKPVLIKT